jgi:AraC-like DNA-binding protein
MLSGLLHSHARDVTQRLPEAGFPAAALEAIEESLRHGDPAIRKVAARLGLTTRTLQRRLDESLGTTFHALVEQTRRDLSLRYLRETRLSLAEISGLLAYSEPSAFGRAFHRWTGTTPATFRRTAATEPSAPSKREGRASNRHAEVAMTRAR